MERVDLIIRNAQVFNSYLKCFRRADTAILNGKIYYVDLTGDAEFAADKEIDGSSYYLLPGFIDIHMHIESSMMTPREFAACAARCGVTTIVSEPHEMANVKGLEGIYEMIEDGKGAPIDIFYGIPSSVPSTGEDLETTGGIIDFEAMKELLGKREVICVGEIMNYRKIIRENDLEITKFLEYLRTVEPNYIIEGHCPSLVGLDLAKFLYLGIDGDHTEHNLEEIRQRLENGMFVELQDKMLKPEILEYIRAHNLYERCGFVTDDTMADKLYEEGHLNKVVEKAVQMGFPLEQAIYCATYTNAGRMNLRDRGTIAPGKLADFMLVKDFQVLEPDYVFKNGVLISEMGTPKASVSDSAHTFPNRYYHSVQVGNVTEEMFGIRVEEEIDWVNVRVIEVADGGTQTREKRVRMPVKDHKIQWENSGCMLAMVFERYGKNGNIGYGFVTGDCIKEGAVATTYFHDHHNLFVMGSNGADMMTGVHKVVELQGAILTVKNGKIMAELPLPIGGILSDKSVREIGTGLKQVRDSCQELGYKHYNPIMSLCTLGLPVSPALKLTDRGLIDVKEGRVVPLF